MQYRRCENLTNTKHRKARHSTVVEKKNNNKEKKNGEVYTELLSEIYSSHITTSDSFQRSM